MKIVIDASNIRRGGGATHLVEILQLFDREKYGIRELEVWAPRKTLDRIGEVKGIVRKSHPLIEKAGISAYWFRKHELDKNITADTDLLWAPGGTCCSSFRPYVTMVRNFLPFDLPERDRFKYSRDWFRFLYLRNAQLSSFKKAKGLIHVSQTAYDVINQLADLSKVKQTTIHHGLSPRFRLPPRPQRDFSEFTEADPARILYVSQITHYKHQDKLVAALVTVRENGIPLTVDLVGPAERRSSKKFKEAVAKFDPAHSWVKWHGEVAYEKVREFTHKADIGIALSTCETFGMFLLEGMASGLPMLSSNRSGLPEINKGSCPEVDPENISAIAEEIEKMLRSKELREKCAHAAYERSAQFTWNRCAEATFPFLAECAKES